VDRMKTQGLAARPKDTSVRAAPLKVEFKSTSNRTRSDLLRFTRRNDRDPQRCCGILTNLLATLDRWRLKSER